MGALLLRRPYSPPSLMGGYGTRTPAGILIPQGLAVDDAFSPLDLSPAWWVEGGISPAYQANDTVAPVTTAGETWGRWDDLSGNGRHVLQATAGNRPLAASVNGILVPDFDGTDDFLTVACTLTSPSGLTLAMVAKIDAAISYGMGLVMTNANNELRQADTTQRIQFISATAGDVNGTTDLGTTARHTLIGTFDDTLNLNEVYVNGVSEGTAAQASTPTYTGPLTVGARSTAAFPWSGPICAGIMLPYRATTAQIAQLHAYWKSRWGTA